MGECPCEEYQHVLRIPYLAQIHTYHMGRQTMAFRYYLNMKTQKQKKAWDRASRLAALNPRSEKTMGRWRMRIRQALKLDRKMEQFKI